MERTITFKSTAGCTNILTTRSKSVRQSATAVTPSVRVLGKLCPCCGEAGAVLCETKKRIIYECPNSHQYETKKRSDDLYNDAH
jgi:hypothetical protein